MVSRRLALSLLVIAGALVACSSDHGPCGSCSTLSHSPTTFGSATGQLHFVRADKSVLTVRVDRSTDLSQSGGLDGLDLDDLVEVAFPGRCDAGSPETGDADAGDPDATDAGDAGDAGTEAGCEAGLVTSHQQQKVLSVRFRLPSQVGVYALSALDALATYCLHGYLSPTAAAPEWECAGGGTSAPVYEPLEGTLEMSEATGSDLSYTIDAPARPDRHVSLHIESRTFTSQGPDVCTSL